MKKTTLALSIITAFGLWGCVGSSSGDDQPVDQGNSQQQRGKLINPSDNSNDNNNNDNGNSGNAGSTGGAGGATGHISGGAGGQPIADDDSSDDDKTGGNDDNDNDDNDNGSDAIPTVAEAQKKVADLEQQITDSRITGNTLAAKKDGAEVALQNVKNQITALEGKQSLSDSEKEQLKELQEKNLPEAQQAADNAQKAVTENAAKTAELNTEKEVAEVGVQISEAKYQNYEPKSKIDALRAQQAVIKATALATEKKGEVDALEDKIGKEASKNQPATGLQKDLQEAQGALKNASEEKRPELAAAVAAAEKALAKAQAEKANADKAQSEADAAKTAAEAARDKAQEADLNRAVVGTSGFDLKTFQNEDSVERTASTLERKGGSIWTVHLNDGSTLNIDPATITLQEHKLVVSDSYYGNIDDKNGIHTYPDSAFGYLGDKFFSVGKTTKIADMPENKTFGYVGSALLKSAEGKDLFATVEAKADFSNHQLSGSFSEFKSYDRDKALKADRNSGYAGDAEAPKDLTNPVAFKANINGNRFEPLIPEGDQDPVKVYGYFYGATENSDGKNVGNLNKNADEIGGLVEYSKFHGAFGAKHSVLENKDVKCYDPSNSYQKGSC